MTRIKRDGRELVIDDAAVTEYLAQGYSVIDDHGNEVKRGKTMDYASAMRRLAEVEAHDAALAKSLEEANAKIKALTAENRKLKADLKKAPTKETDE